MRDYARRPPNKTNLDAQEEDLLFVRAELLDGAARGDQGFAALGLARRFGLGRRDLHGCLTALQRQKVPSRLLVYHAANHWIMRGPDARNFWGEVHAWLARWL